MKWPNKPTYHVEDPRIASGVFKMKWRPQRDIGNSANISVGRSCSFCGSIHPEDAAKALVTPGVRVEIADWKYGYPHKVYITDIPVDGAPNTEKVRIRDKGGLETYEAGSGWAKFYIKHLLDTGYDDEAMAEITNALHLTTRFQFTVEGGPDDRRLHYKRSPMGSA